MSSFLFFIEKELFVRLSWHVRCYFVRPILGASVHLFRSWAITLLFNSSYLSFKRERVHCALGIVTAKGIGYCFTYKLKLEAELLGL